MVSSPSYISVLTMGATGHSLYKKQQACHLIGCLPRRARLGPVLS